MKRIEQTNFSKVIYGLKFYLDELEHIVEIIENRDYDLALKDNVNIYDNLEELVAEHPQGMNYLDISANNPDGVIDSCSIIINKESTHLLTLTGSAETRTLLLDIQNALGSGRSRWFHIFFPIILITIGGILPTLARQLNNIDSFAPNTDFEPVAWITFGFLILVTIIVYVYRHHSKVIVTEHHRKSQSFFQRNSDDLIKLLIGAIIGVAGTLLVIYLTE